MKGEGEGKGRMTWHVPRKRGELDSVAVLDSGVVVTNHKSVGLTHTILEDAV